MEDQRGLNKPRKGFNPPSDKSSRWSTADETDLRRSVNCCCGAVILLKPPGRLTSQTDWLTLGLQTLTCDDKREISKPTRVPWLLVMSNDTHGDADYRDEEDRAEQDTQNDIYGLTVLILDQLPRHMSVRVRLLQLPTAFLFFDVRLLLVAIRWTTDVFAIFRIF